ncbi:MAG: hypothetical protein GWP19_00540 [Planctomycetia bacterium]|nr:hypothetical protein [Planctomycetia bacterium]
MWIEIKNDYGNDFLLNLNQIATIVKKEINKAHFSYAIEFFEINQNFCTYSQEFETEEEQHERFEELKNKLLTKNDN